MWTRIGTQMILGAGLGTAVTIGLMAVLVTGAHERDLTEDRLREADLFSDTIKSSTHYNMMENHREGLHRQIETIGQQEGIERVRVFNKDGVIMFSSDSEEIGLSVDKQAESCYACHAAGRPLQRLSIVARTRVFRKADGDRVLGIINPIQNQPGCSTASCHAHSADQSLLGVLDVTVSLAHVDAQIARSRARMAGFTTLAILASSLVLAWMSRRLVVRPVQALAAGTRALAEGDLTTQIPETGSHELGELARAFNSMTRKLAEARHQIVQAEKLASVGRLAAGVAHEINNPLTGVLTYASLLRKQVEDQPEVAEDLDVIVRETKRCREIVKGLLDFSRQTAPDRKPTDVNEVVRRAIAVVMYRLKLGRVSLDLDLSPDPEIVPADANQIQQVVVNLLLNAIDALGASGGTVRVKTRSMLLPPRGNAEIAHASCSKGCDLLDSQVRIGTLRGIRVIRAHGARESVVQLDPVYGRFNHVDGVPSGRSVEATFSCPECRASLDVPQGCCPDCGAGIFAVTVADGEQVEWCRRSGCRWTRWQAREADGPQPYLEIVVGDSGHGIPPELLAHVFDPFFSTKGARGTGLGLAVTWGIVAGHDGSIAVESEVGRGTRFSVRLPRETREQAYSSVA